MMKMGLIRNLTCGLIAITFAGILEAAPAHADPDFSKSPQEIYQQIKDSSNISLKTAAESLSGLQTDDQDILDLQQLVNDLSACSGVYMQEKDPDRETSKDHYATLDFYLMGGVPMCRVDYDNFMGSVSDGVVRRDDSGDYLFITEPRGKFFSGDEYFHIKFDAENMDIAWGSDEEEITCEYRLHRASEDEMPPETETEATFENSSTWDLLRKKLDEFGTPYHMNYEQDKDRLTLYFDLGASREMLQSLSSDKWNSLLDSYVKVAYAACQVMRAGSSFDDNWGYNPTCTIEAVDGLDIGDDYSDEEVLATVNEDGVQYNCLSGGSGSSTYGSSAGSSSSGGPTMGEQNALEKAHDYLDYTAFSYSGLIDQLEFEGYSASEATYAADHCGADWNEQAAKKARQYLDYSSFSRSGLIDQLKFEGFTSAQAEYGARMNGY